MEGGGDGGDGGGGGDGDGGDGDGDGGDGGGDGCTYTLLNWLVMKTLYLPRNIPQVGKVGLMRC